MDHVTCGVIAIRDMEVLRVETRTNRGNVLAHLPPHVHDDYQIVYAPAVVSRYTYQGTRHIAPPATLVILHPDEIHAAAGIADLSPEIPLYVFHLCPHFVQTVRGEDDTPGVGSPPLFETVLSNTKMTRDLEKLTKAVYAPGPNRLDSQERLVRYVSRLVARSSPPPTPVSEPALDRQVVELIRDYLHANIGENVSIDTLCKITGMSRTRLCDGFRRTAGLSLHAFQIQVRTERAKMMLLRSSASLPDVARATGFADQSHLTRHFKRLVGVSPGRYRIEKVG